MSLGFCSSGFPSPVSLQGDARTSQVPGEPLCTCPALRPRQSLSARYYSALVSPSAIGTTSASATISLSGLYHTAHTLAVHASRMQLPASMQDSLLAGYQPWPGGIAYPQGSYRRFPPFRSLLLHRFPLRQTCPGALQNRFSGRLPGRESICKLPLCGPVVVLRISPSCSRKVCRQRFGQHPPPSSHHPSDGGVENESPTRSRLSGTQNPSKTPKSNYLGQQ